MKKYKKIIGAGLMGAVMAVSGVNVNLRVAASNINDTYTVENSKEEIEASIQDMELQLMQVKEDTLNEVLSEIQCNEEIKEAINDTDGVNVNSLLDEVEKRSDVNDTAEMLVDVLAPIDACEWIVNVLEQQLELMTIEDYEKQEIVNRFTNKSIDTVEEMKEYLEMLGYSVDDEGYNICNKLESYKQENIDSTLSEQVENLNMLIDDTRIQNIISFGTKVNAASVSYDAWTKLTTDEKVLIATDPKKALITKSLSETAYKWTKDKFGRNGLGDKSDAFRHATWNALMTRDITRQWAKSYATAHESGKSAVDLEKKAADGYKEKDHRNMDLHNNEIGRETIKWYDTVINVKDKDVKERVTNKLTNNKKTGAYWLHK